MPIAPPLQQFVESELASSAVLIQQATRELRALLRAPGVGPTAADLTLRAELAARVDRQAPSYEAAFVASLSGRVRAELARQDGVVAPSVTAPSEIGRLSLMDESRVEIDIEISRATEVIDAAAEWELRELQTFTSTLIGQSYVSAESNPLRPTLYAAALWDAACVVHPGFSHRAMLLRLSAAACAPLLKRAWAGASTRLETQGVTPGAYRSRVLSRTTVRRSTAPPDANPDSAVIRQVVAAMPGGPAVLRGAERFAPDATVTPAPAAVPPAVTEATESALGELDAILRELPPKSLSKLQIAALTGRLQAHRSALAATSATTPDRQQVVEMLSRVFDVMLGDTELNPAFVGVVARLQVPALRLALHEPAALTSTAHPMWQLLDRIGESSGAYPQAADRRNVGLHTLCTRFADELVRQPTQGADLCRKALERLGEYLAAQWQSQRKSAEPQVRLLLEAERLETLEHEIAQRLGEQMALLQPTAPVRRFLAGPWARVLATALLRQSENDEPARSYIRLVDDLLWSVQSPDHPASRQRLAALLPPMLECLQRGMASIDLPEGEQQAIRHELHTIHAAALQRVEPGEMASVAGALQPAPARAEDRPAPREAMIDVASLETVPAELMPMDADSAAADAPARQVAGLAPGDRARLFIEGRWSRVQLLWRSERGDFLLFAGEALGETHSITRRALERLAAAGLVRPVEDLSLSRRAFETLERRMAAATVATDGS